MKAATTHTSQYTDAEKALYIAFELSRRSWKLGITVGFGQKARERNVKAGIWLASGTSWRPLRSRGLLRDDPDALAAHSSISMFICSAVERGPCVPCQVSAV
jgi:hypothetical protein